MNTLLVKRYGLMSRKEFSEFSGGRRGAAHGGHAPKDRPGPTTPWLLAVHSVVVQALQDLAAEGRETPCRRLRLGVPAEPKPSR